MEIFKIILFILAYTIGVVTITIQFICYLKEIEYKETLFFSISFLFLIVSITFSEFSTITNENIKLINEFSIYFFSLVLGLSTSINIHKERMIENEKLKNKILVLIALIVFLVLITCFVFGFVDLAKIVVMTYLYSSIFYSMLLIARAKPSLLIKHREKAEEITSKLFLYFFSTYSIIGLLNNKFNVLSESLFDGAIISSLIFIALAISKFTDDIDRLTMFPIKNKYESDKLSEYNISPRELEVLNLLVLGISYKEIAEKLFISLPTVKTHVSNIYRKMSINNKVELINFLND